jgi:UDPglucose 6-dehydrogenase
MFDFPKIGIVGLGFVGSAIRKSIEGFNLVLIDKDPLRGTNTFNDLVSCEGVFVCVPSPQGDDGSCDTSILEEVLANLKKIGYTGVIISKTTAPPSVYKKLQSQYPNLVHAPEFLTAANAEMDYLAGKFAIIGGSVLAYRNEAERIIKMTQTSLQTINHCSIEEAALSKYAINSFLATKVIFMNELHKLATASGVDYNVIARNLTLDSRIGTSHMKVPGPDGVFGFGGMCFPKDTSALLKYAEEVNSTMNVLDAAVKKNTLLRLTEPK